MKQILTLTLLFTINNGYSQKISKSDTAVMPLSSPRFIKTPIDEGDYWTFKQSSTQARIKANSDTLEIIGNSIKFIKIDGKTYEIKRNTELVEVNGFVARFRIIEDTLSSYNGKYLDYIKKIDSLIIFKKNKK